jgi:hypothetical protein
VRRVAALAEQADQGLGQDRERCLGARGRFGAGLRELARAARGLDDGVVEDELVARLDQEAGRRGSGSAADHFLVQLAHLQHERREVAVSADDHERVDVRLRERQIERVHHHRDVRAVLVVHAVRRELVHRHVVRQQALLEPGEPTPVGVGPGDQHAPLVLDSLKDGFDVEPSEPLLLRSGCDVFEIDQDCEVGFHLFSARQVR